MFILLDTAEKIKDMVQKTELIAEILLVVIALSILIGVIYLIYFHKKTVKPDVVRRDTNNYIKTIGKITEVKKFEYSVIPYQQEKALKEALAEERSQKSNDKKNKNKNKSSQQGLVGILPHYAYNDANVEKIDKVRYDVRYEFKDTERGEVYRGTFSVYEEKEDVAEGEDIDVMYNPAKPTANYTKYNSPIGRY